MDNYVGKRLDGRYEIQEIIGVGGMAVVYKAYDNIDDRIVAVKILKEEFLANEEFRRRFKNESKAIAVLSHPNIVKVYDVSFGDRLQYIVMECIEGITLKEYIEQQKVINWKEAVHFATQILRALQHAHDKGIVHRDVKPQNILLLQNGNIKVTDFGIARFCRGETRTMTANAIGSVHYISPEQARGEITDDKADIYSVGVVLYEMITGQLPFQSDSAVSVAIMQLQSDAKKPREINNNIPIGLEQITMRAMQKSPKDRYQSAAEMLLDIDEFKRNPSIKFDYNYFVDSEPTKFIDKPVSPAAPKTVSTVDKDDDYDEYDEEDVDERNKAVPIIVGVISALLVVVLLVVGFLFLFTDVFKTEKVTVPNFVGMNYEDDIKDNKEYKDFKFDVDPVSGDSSKAGQVTKQSPYADAKVKKGSKIKLEVISDGKKKTIPDVVGLELATAKETLSDEGFTNVTSVTVLDEDAVKGTITRIDPAEGKKVDVDDKITLYVATDESKDKVKVPDVVHDKLNDAKNIIKSKGLAVGTVSQDESSLPKDTVISQSINPNQEVDKNTKINLVVSSGKPANSSTSINFKLPNDDGYNGRYTVYLNGRSQGSDSITLSGGTQSANITGSGSSDRVEVRITGSSGTHTVYKATVDFTQNPPSVFNVGNYPYPVKPVETEPETNSNSNSNSNSDDSVNGTSILPSPFD